MRVLAGFLPADNPEDVSQPLSLQFPPISEPGFRNDPAGSLVLDRRLSWSVHIKRRSQFSKSEGTDPQRSSKHAAKDIGTWTQQPLGAFGWGGGEG